MTPSLEVIRGRIADIPVERHARKTLESRVFEMVRDAYFQGKGERARSARPLEPDAYIERIQRVVALDFGLRREDLTGDCQARRIAHPRQLAIYLSRELTGKSVSIISRYFRRDHTTGFYAVEMVERRRKADPALQARIDRLYQQLRSGGEHVTGSGNAGMDGCADRGHDASVGGGVRLLPTDLDRHMAT